MEKYHIVILLFVTNQAEVIMRIQTESTFRESLQVFVETCFGFFHPAFYINLFCSGIRK